jgi:hypothetical protein
MNIYESIARGCGALLSVALIFAVLLILDNAKNKSYFDLLNFAENENQVVVELTGMRQLKTAGQAHFLVPYIKITYPNPIAPKHDVKVDAEIEYSERIVDLEFDANPYSQNRSRIDDDSVRIDLLPHDLEISIASSNFLVPKAVKTLSEGDVLPIKTSWIIGADEIGEYILNLKVENILGDKVFMFGFPTDLSEHLQGKDRKFVPGTEYQRVYVNGERLNLDSNSEVFLPISVRAFGVIKSDYWTAFQVAGSFALWAVSMGMVNLFIKLLKNIFCKGRAKVKFNGKV